MRTEWDYTHLAEAYRKRPAYSPEVVGAILDVAGVAPGDPVCDLGAGIGHLTLPLLSRGLAVTAVEPNDAMRAIGRERTASQPNVRWVEGVAEATGLESGAFALATFGSSFNVTDRAKALAECRRILRPRGWFACMWNHRDLDDPIQKAIEAVIAGRVPDYGYGTRREDQTAVIAGSGLFEDIRVLEGRILHGQHLDDVIEAWRSHATLQRQAGESFASVVADIEAYLRGLGRDAIQVPYTTRAWVARATD